ncbi:MAG: hypothetical protein A3G33_03050 [Omnitrophica bacterium RIFCSPLOWO2_12_FULL_44_17]|uniref:Uncharacterized protein n=1 Tax=Candidatus Danuiimicrobium aquiferis TaxID=1801832 RepID=A0A1G1KQT7_9BACT|nr:MAG: hypothetical protein A3B72_01805 [Omnitrophica bacterium RIFCSPHIGHO2_02_FULL_45_28]OGW95314.1 MAG: hypothetical protein A3G33_03050 [Omnitrophica bacterium RIFCSPLOWO2_12_FULL_44_17]OGX04717.1 MAG: hypothetical protein A3J12_09080 [Omnitrophica bacterium RIFCSPLOWO2_02_FULL_44_11]
MRRKMPTPDIFLRFAARADFGPAAQTKIDVLTLNRKDSSRIFSFQRRSERCQELANKILIEDEILIPDFFMKEVNNV